MSKNNFNLRSIFFIIVLIFALFSLNSFKVYAESICEYAITAVSDSEQPAYLASYEQARQMETENVLHHKETYHGPQQAGTLLLS
jgi:hypothetical protein